MKYKRIENTNKWIPKPIPKLVNFKSEIKSDILKLINKEIENKLKELKDGQAIAFYYRFQIYDETQGESRLIRNSEEYKEWRRNIYERDGYKCSLCGSEGKRLNAHHIKKFCADSENRLTLENGITLCVDCHKKLHKSDKK